MLEGIEILNTYQAIHLGECIFYIVFLGLLFVLFVIGLVIQFFNKELFIVMGIGALFFGVLLWASVNELIEETDRIYYKVTISDSVSMNEFNERYKIYEQDGVIYTIYEKEKK